MTINIDHLDSATQDVIRLLIEMLETKVEQSTIDAINLEIKSINTQLGTISHILDSKINTSDMEGIQLQIATLDSQHKALLDLSLSKVDESFVEHTNLEFGKVQESLVLLQVKINQIVESVKDLEETMVSIIGTAIDPINKRLDNIEQILTKE